MAHFITSQPSLDQIRDQFIGPSTGAISISSFYRGGTYVDDVSSRSGESDGNKNIPGSGVVSWGDYIGSGYHRVDSASFTSATSGTQTGFIKGVLGTAGTGMTSFGNSPAMDIDILLYDSTGGYLYFGSTGNVTSAANYANTGYSSFRGLEIAQPLPFTKRTFTIDDSDYAGYAYDSGSGYYLFTWGSGVSSPFQTTSQTIYKIDTYNTSY